MKTYTQTVDALYGLQIFAIKLGLENITALCDALSHPQKNYPVIHIAGTNGKGSTAFFLAQILMNMGLKTGLFTSPHLSDFRERITVNGKKIEKEFIVSFWDETEKLALERKATFFDTTTALGLSYFSKQKVDVAIVETGLGGRLDSTNIVEPRIVVITPVDFDHEKQLGNTLSAIAAEKAGIIKDHAAVFCARQKASVLKTVKERLFSNNRFFYLSDHVKTEVLSSSLQGTVFKLEDIIHRQDYQNLTCRQLGSYQLDNIALAYFISRVFLREEGRIFNEQAFRQVLETKIWPGRMQLIQKKPNIFFDVSHNAQGIQQTLMNIKDLMGGGRLIVLLGMVKDKKEREVCKIIEASAHQIVLTEPDTHRKLEGEALLRHCNPMTKKPHLVKDLQAAYEFSIELLKPADTLLVVGSHYLIGPLLERLNKVN